jgi:SAM-dependent MidA family methyltransferase
MSSLVDLLRDEIRRDGPLPFRRFMQAALYHPEHGYYRNAHDPFGAHGDFYTAEQLQPVFGILIAARIRELYHQMHRPPDFTIVEIGAGRREMAAAFEEWSYIPVDLPGPALPERVHGVVFANEFFDALPIDVAVRRNGCFREQCVDWNGRFVWVDGPPAVGDIADYLGRYFPMPVEGARYEVPLEALYWMDRIAHTLAAGFAFIIDYGYTSAEIARFPQGSLMSYHRHQAMEDVLDDPGRRDITAHVAFTALQDRAAQAGLRTVRFETLAQTLLAAGEPDQFASALAGAAQPDLLRRRLQLKTLLFDMGETFRTLLLKKEEDEGKEASARAAK